VEEFRIIANVGDTISRKVDQHDVLILKPIYRLNTVVVAD